MEQTIRADILTSFPAVDEAAVDALLRKEIAADNTKFIVLDDDPTGVQTVHDISVYTDWSVDSIKSGLLEDNKVFYILTNSRGLTAAETTAPAAAAPDFTVYDVEGNPVSLSDFFGRPIVLNFWASWCGPCKMELPDFQTVYDEVGGDVQFLMINLTDGSRETVETASAYLKEQGYTLPAYYDTQLSAAMAYGVSAIPCTYFIDAQGCAIARSSGAIDAQTLQKGIALIQ